MMACDGGLKDILQNMQTEIIKLVDLTYLLPILRRKRLVTETQFQMLSMESNPEERSKKLVRMVMGKGMNGFDLFVEALKEEREYLNHSILAKKLSQEKNRIKGGKSAKPPIPAPRTKKPVKSSPPLPPKPEPMTKLRRVHSEVTRKSSTEESLLLKPINDRLSAVEEEMKAIKNTNISLEQKLGRAIEMIENKLDNFFYALSGQVYDTRANMQANTNSSPILVQPLRALREENEYIYATAHSNEYTDSNEYTEYTNEGLYDSIAETPDQQSEQPNPTCVHDYIFWSPPGGHDLATRYMPLSDANRESSNGTYHYTRRIKQQISPQVQEKLTNEAHKKSETQLDCLQEFQSISEAKKCYIRSQETSESISEVYQYTGVMNDLPIYQGIGIDQTKNEATCRSTSPSPYPSISTCDQCVSICTESIDGPCKINCSGETGGIYYLRNHGLKLYFPPKCSQQSIEIVIYVYLSDVSPIKPGLQIASAIFKFQSNIKMFEEAVTLTIPHCIKIKSDEDKRKMCFVIRRGNDEPNIRRDGHFPIKKSYGSLKITEFCKISIAYDDRKLHSSKDHSQTLSATNGEEKALNQRNNNSCKMSNNQLINGLCQQNSQQYQGQQRNFGTFSRNVINYQVLLAFPLNRDKLTTSWCAAFYIFRSTASWKHHTINSINKEDRINSPFEIFSKEVDFVPLDESSGISTEEGVATLKVDNDPNAHWFVDPHPNKVEIQTVENLLDEVAYYSKEYADYSSLIQHKNPPRSLIYVNKRQLAGNCVQLNSQLEINGIKDIQQIDLIKTNKQGFKHEIINEKTNQPSIITAEPLPEYYSSKPTMKLLHKYVFKHIAYNWDEIADILEFTIDQKRLITKTGRGDPKECCKRLFEDWLMSDGIGPKTWGTLLEELDNSGSYETAFDEIKRSLREHYAKSSCTDI